MAVFCSALLLLAASGASADGDDPPSRIARISYAEGSISFQPAGTSDWVPAPLNRPLSTGDVLWADNSSRAELQLDGSVVRLSNSSELTLVNLSNDVTQLQLSSGTLILRVRRLDDNETYEVDTPNLAFSVLRPGSYRISVDPSGNTTAIAVRSGQGEVSGAGSAYTVQSGDYDQFSGTDQLSAEAQPNQPGPDSFETWSSDRDSRWDRSPSAQYVSTDVVGYQDLDEQGSWRDTPEYGQVWYPNGVAVGWAPYQQGHWSYIAPWGYTWVDDQPWGFAPFHYGRWIWNGGAWGWIPSPPRPEHGPYFRPVYAPALVAWVGTGAAIAWFALGPREVYVPRYPCSANYMRNVNVSNTTVNTTVINNVYNTTIINNKTVNNITYVNRAAPGAITATSTAAFTSAQPVARNLVRVDRRELTAAPVQALAPAVVPTKQAVLGSSRVANSKPPAAVLTRAVVARTPPPAPPPTFERRQEAIKNNGGKPLSVEQVHQIQPATAVARSAPIRIAPRALPVALKPGASARAIAQPPQSVPPRVQAPPDERMPISHTAPAAVHVNQLPAPPKPASPSVAQSVIDREQLQQQQQMRAQQEQERQRMQQQQELEHERVAKQQADAARAQELERQHQQQTQELQQRHIQEQQALQARQQEERRSVPPAPPPPPSKPPEQQHKPPEPHKPPQ